MATRLTRDERLWQALGKVDAAMQRAAPTYSKQNRFTDAQTFINSFYKWIKAAELEQVPYSPNSSARDAWLRRFWKQNPHIKGVISSVVSIDKNRGWWLSGGRNQVLRFDAILQGAENGAGWRDFMSVASMSHYTSDLGAIVEIGREFEGGPLRALYNVDPVACRLTGNPDTPLAYKGTDGANQEWRPDDFFRISSLPSDDQEYNRLGYCALSRAYEAILILVSVLMHDLEMLGGKAPRGLLLLQNITQDQWHDAMEMRRAEQTSKESEFYGLIDVIAHMGSEPPDAKLFALSQLPANFDLQTTMDLMMYTIALCFNYAPIEFWPVNVGALGRGRESEIQHTSGTGKGGKDFVLGFQQQLQQKLPPTLLWQFEERDSEGELMDAELQQAWANVAITLSGAGLLSPEEARQYLVDKGIVPADWAIVADESSADDEGEKRMRGIKERYLDSEAVRRAIVKYPKEPIISRHSSGRQIMLWCSGEEALQRRSWAIPEIEEEEPFAIRRPRLIRAADDVLGSGAGVQITEGDVLEAFSDGADRVDTVYVEYLNAEPAEGQEPEEEEGEEDGDTGD